MKESMSGVSMNRDIVENVTGAEGAPGDADDGERESGSEGRSQGSDEEQGREVRGWRRRRGRRQKEHGGV